MFKPSYEQIHSLLYPDIEENEINEVILEENEVMESEIEFISKELSHNDTKVPEISVVEIDEKEFVAAAEALKMQTDQEDLDMRPYLFDGNSKQYIFLDSGSQVCAWPPDPGDAVDPSVRLKAVNGSRMRCYGYKEVDIRINRKTYPIRVIKTDVNRPILGWNFTRKHRLFTGWTEWGDVVISDPKANVSQVLKYRSLKNQTHQVSFVEKSSQKSSRQLAFEVSSVEALGQEEEKVVVNDLESVPEGEFKEMLKRYPELLEFSFKTEEPKNNIVHRIKTTDNDPIRAKVRRYPPGSPKAVQGKKAIEELEKLGIIEKVDPSKPTNFVSPVHFAVKPDGSLRTVGDFRLLNQKTILDQYPLPNLKSWHSDIAGSKIFSKVDIVKAFHHLKIDKRDRWKTCIITPWGLYND